MSLGSATVTGNVRDYGGVVYNPDAGDVVRGWVSYNSPVIFDTSNGQMRLGDTPITIDSATGAWTVTVWTPGADGNPTSWQSTFHFEYSPRGDVRAPRTKLSLGPFTVTASTTLAALSEEMPAAPDIPLDVPVAALIEDTESDTRAALDGVIDSAVTEAIGDIPAVPTASTTVAGVVELSTPEEAVTGEADDLAVTPAALTLAMGEFYETYIEPQLDSFYFAVDFVVDTEEDLTADIGAGPFAGVTPAVGSVFLAIGQTSGSSGENGIYTFNGGGSAPTPVDTGGYPSFVLVNDFGSTYSNQLFRLVFDDGGSLVDWAQVADATSSATALAAVLASSLQKAANLSDLEDPAAARTNLGLGTAAVAPSSSFEPAITTLPASKGGTGTNSTPTAGQALVGRSSGFYRAQPGFPTAWSPSTVYSAYQPVILPTGGLGYSTSDRTSRASWDATERAAWTFIPGNHTETLTTTGTWTCPTGISTLTVVDVLGGGGGGNGGGSASSISNQVGGPGGSAGERCIYRNLAVTPGTGYTVTIGGGGTGGTGAAAGGNPGGLGTDGSNSAITIGANIYRGRGGSRGGTPPANSGSSVSAAFPAQTWGTTNGPIPGQGGVATNTFGNPTAPLNGCWGGGGGGPANATNGGLGGSTVIDLNGTVGSRSAGGSATSSGTAGADAGRPGGGGGGGGGGAPGGAGGAGGAGFRGELTIEF